MLSSGKNADQIVTAIVNDTTGVAQKNFTKFANQISKDILDVIKTKQTPNEILDNLKKRASDNYQIAKNELSSFAKGKTTQISTEELDSIKKEFLGSVAFGLEAKDYSVARIFNFIDKELAGKELSFDDLDTFRAKFNTATQNIWKQKGMTYDNKAVINSLRSSINEAIKRVLDDDTAYAFYSKYKQDYSEFAKLRDTDQIRNMLKLDGSKEETDRVIKLINERGSAYDSLTKQITADELSDLENGIIKNFMDINTAHSKEGVKDVNAFVDFRALSNQLDEIEFKSETAKAIKKKVDELSRTRGSVYDIITHLNVNSLNKPLSVGSSLSNSLLGSAQVTFINQFKKMLWKYVPKLGDSSALQYHLQQAVKYMKASDNADFKNTLLKEIYNGNKNGENSLKVIKDLIAFANEMGRVLKSDIKLSNDELQSTVNFILKGDGFVTYPQTATKKEAEAKLTRQRNEIEKHYNIKPIKEFGTNYAEFYHDGSNAIQKLLAEKQGQVAGAFEKEGKDITLVWGIEGTSHSDGYGLAKIAKYHPEAIDKLDNIISKGEFYKDEKGRLNIRYNDDIVGLRENWLGNETAPWIISSYTKKVETSKGVNSASSITPSKENYSFTTQHSNIISQTTDNINPANQALKELKDKK
ncbi:hypothetical protein [Campylobacter hyointestinalis]|uniref:Phage-Barnase-EndoU-ColicinE5/D-RelE-like nuclease domain-containing protein n=1 Tax=Campylobacter hyointestinalis subsp. hyointestinalis TaxID=91352 RepID=A0A9W5EST4_CAMHY|nr:hypothetical protein [Campylobacter hyointestinalis]CUU74287.1 Uncharacterised protein [Campylobacter hyointestinalis subsp. hyointestinalis]CUU82080.1 Uncharacterised protein [Campylobacter hyointestinalis subsp. hyointestinalis]